MDVAAVVATALIFVAVQGRNPPTLPEALEGLGHEKADGFAVRWVRRVNTRRLVRTVFQDRENRDRITMIQGDVLAHPATRAAVMSFTSTDQSKHVTLESWFTELNQQTRHRRSTTGIRLNVLYENTTSLVISTAGRLQDRYSHQGANGPFWLHADVLAGPNGKNTVPKPINPYMFADDCLRFFKGATVSLGWTTKLPGRKSSLLMPDSLSFNIEERYTWSHLLDMVELLKKIKQPVNFVVAEPFLSQLTTEIAWILKTRKDATVTAKVENDGYFSRMKAIAIARQCIDKSRVFVDYTPTLGKEAPELPEMEACPSSTWDSSKWAILQHAQDPDVLKSDFGVIMLGRPSSTLRSEHHFQAPNDSHSVPKQQVRGTVHFVAPESEPTWYPNDTKYIPTLVIHLKETGDPTPIAPVEGSIRVELNAKGRLYIEDARDPTLPVGLRKRASADFCQFPCYDFMVNDFHDRVVFRVRLSQLCTGLNRSDVLTANAANGIRTLSLKIDHALDSEPPQQRYRRYAVYSEPVQSSWVFVEGGGQAKGGNRIILERLAHRPLTDALLRAGFNHASAMLLSTAAFVNVVLSLLVIFVDSL